MTYSIEQLYEMQTALDAHIIETKGLRGKDLLPNTVLALDVEIGELANEWRGFKHWSNDQAPRMERALEEYVDCVHFFLSIARQKDWLENMYIPEDAIEETKETGLDGGIGGALLETKYWLMKMYMEKDRDEKLESKIGKTKQEFCFANAWYVFFAIGIVGLGFTWEQIAEAYVSKNAVNHQRQQNGY